MAVCKHVILNRCMCTIINDKMGTQAEKQSNLYVTNVNGLNGHLLVSIPYTPTLMSDTQRRTHTQTTLTHALVSNSTAIKVYAELKL
jgi:hypothetical protein